MTSAHPKLPLHWHCPLNYDKQRSLGTLCSEVRCARPGDYMRTSDTAVIRNRWRALPVAPETLTLSSKLSNSKDRVEWQAVDFLVGGAPARHNS